MADWKDVWKRAVAAATGKVKSRNKKTEQYAKQRRCRPFKMSKRLLVDGEVGKETAKALGVDWY